jgi:glycylpeptide N-tetradecanoyltransferase
MARYVKILKLPNEPTLKGFREMEKGDVKAVHALLAKYLKRFDVHLEFNVDEIEHFLLPREGVIDTYVI